VRLWESFSWLNECINVKIEMKKGLNPGNICNNQIISPANENTDKKTTKLADFS